MSLRPLAVTLGRRPHERLHDFRDLATLSGLRLIPNRPDGLRITRVSHQKACHVGLQRRGKRFECFLRITPLPTLQHGDMTGRHVQPTCNLFKSKPAMLTPFAYECSFESSFLADHFSLQETEGSATDRRFYCRNDP